MLSEGGRHYLDHASTTPLRPSAAEAMAAFALESSTATGAGDPGRLHAEGRAARAALEEAREKVAGLLGAQPSRLVFTSGATEAANTAVAAAALAAPDGRGPILCGAVEHSSVRLAAERAGLVLDWPVDRTGRLELGFLDDLLADRAPMPLLVNCQWANHEVGTLQPVSEVVGRCRERGVPVHVDAAAAAGHVPIDLSLLEADYVSVSAHKLGGPPGVGALVVRRGVRLSPLLLGGSEERGRRAGAENLPGAVGFGAAALELSDGGAFETEVENERSLTASVVRMAESLVGVRVVGPEAPDRLCHIVTVGFDEVLAEAVLVGLDRAGVAVHSGSACSSEVLEPSPVLGAMGEDPDRSLRISVGWCSTGDDVAALASVLPEVLERLRALSAGT